VELPGGIRIDGALKRSFRFKPVTGDLEIALSEIASGAGTTPARITAVLSEALAELGGQAVNASRVRKLSVGDRQYLMGRLAVHFDDQPVWLTAECGQCHELFDVSLKFAELPVKPAGKDFPETTVVTELGRLRVRVPTGADQEAIATIDDETEALHLLLQRLVSTVEPSRVFDVAQLNENDIAVIETRVEAMAPETATHLLTHCPSCATENQLPIVHYASLQGPSEDLYAEIHRLAISYHWSESEILALTRARRQIYLQLIDQSRGMQTQQTIIEAG
jgi:hypothetical protein